MPSALMRARQEKFLAVLEVTIAGARIAAACRAIVDEHGDDYVSTRHEWGELRRDAEMPIAWLREQLRSMQRDQAVLLARLRAARFSRTETRAKETT